MSGIRRVVAGAALAALAAATGVVGLAGAAGAVQTETFSLDVNQAAGAATARTVLSGLGDAPAVDSVVVGNRTDGRITVTFSVTPAKPSGRGFALGGPTTPMARAVVPAERSVTLAPHQVQVVAIDIAPVPGTPTYAALLAQANGTVSAGGLDVGERLALLVESSGGVPVPVSAAAHHHGIGPTLPLVAGGLLAATAGLLVAEGRRSGRRGSGTTRVVAA